MSPAERAQAVALLTAAEALRNQGAALMHLAESQIQAANALLGMESEGQPSSAEALAAAAAIFEKPEQKARHYGSRPNQHEAVS